MSGYKKYDDSIKEMIIKSGNLNFFPELNIPRTTAQSWIYNNKRKVKLKNLDVNSALEDKIKKLEDELIKERSKTLFLKSFIRNVTGLQDLLNKKKNRVHIVDSVEHHKKYLSINELCRLLNIRSTKFHRLRTEVIGCERISYKRCKLMAANQVTFREQEKIYNMVNDQRLGHLSVKGMMFYASRYENLFLGYETWRKYVREFGGKKRTKPKKVYRKGIRAKKPNELWHMDITEFTSREGKKIYLQVIMDNYSRRIISWQLSESKDKSITVRNLRKSVVGDCPEVIMSDGGKENLNYYVSKILLGKNISSLVAKKDVSFSNSMVERFFNTLKNRYLDKTKRTKFSRLYGKIERSVVTFNNTPHSKLQGATPNEVFYGIVSMEGLALEFKRKKKEWAKLRPEINQFCKVGKKQPCCD